MKVNFNVTKHKFDWKAFIAWLIFVGIIMWFIFKQVIKVKVDTNKIEWLLNNITQYRIHKDTGVNLSILGRLVRGERKVENLTIKTGSALTEYAEKLQKQEN